MSIQPRIERPLVVPHETRGIMDAVKLRAELMAKVRVITREMHIVRPNGESPAGALLEAIANGLVRLVRADDPQEHEFQIVTVPRKQATGGDGTDGTDTREVRGRRRPDW